LYSYCEKNGIPITAHGSEGGFVVVKDKNRLKEITDIAKWDKVLSKYPELKLNLAHFPINEKKWFLFNKTKRLEAFVNLIKENRPNVYFDFSCRALNEKYYTKLKKYISNKPNSLQEELRKRILFGSDFPMSLMSLDSYDEYLGLFSNSTSIDGLKEQFCSVNPDKFLFK
jgi:predicted TIM-barrel fold metal-dependent hydrolase